MNRSPSVEEIQDLVEYHFMERPFVAFLELSGQQKPSDRQQESTHYARIIRSLSRICAPLEANGAYKGTREKPTFRRGKRPCRLTDSHNENLEQGNNYQEGEVVCLKASDKLAVATQPRLLILPKGNERC